MQKITEGDNFESFFFDFWALETGLDIMEQLSNFQQLLYSMYIFYKKKFMK